jgi:uncharacterized RDD family membrane protein YckC
MNKHQKQVLILCAGILLAMLLFPPFQVQVRGTAFNMGYHYLAEPPRRGSIPASVNVQMLLAQWVGVALLGAVAVLLLKEPPDGGNATRGNATSAQPPLSPAAPPPVDQSRTFLGGHHHPWRRFFARMIDSILFSVLVAVAFAVLLPETAAELTADSGAWILLEIVALILMIPVEAVLISNFKTTLGKWIFGIEVTTPNGDHLSFQDAARRSVGVWVKGRGLDIPFVPLITMLFAYRRLTRTGTTLWDTSSNAIVTHQQWTPARAIGAVASVVALFVGISLITQESRMPSQEVQETSGQKITYEEAVMPRKRLSYEEGIGTKPSAPATDEDGWAAYNRGDYTTALRVFRALADRGDTDAQNNIGFMYANGQGVATNYAEAVKWYRLAAEAGYAIAQSNLGAMYVDGKGVAKNYAEAARWYRLAAEQGNAIAQNMLGFMYGNGEGVAQDRVQAYKWLELAATLLPLSDAANRKIAVENRDLVATLMTPAELAEAQRLVREWKPQAAHGTSSASVTKEAGIAKQPTIERGTYKKDQVARPCVFKGVMTNADYRACGLTPP